jgi:hypothetical protein
MPTRTRHSAYYKVGRGFKSHLEPFCYRLA